MRRGLIVFPALAVVVLLLLLFGDDSACNFAKPDFARPVSLLAYAVAAPAMAVACEEIACAADCCCCCCGWPWDFAEPALVGVAAETAGDLMDCAGGDSTLSDGVVSCAANVVLVTLFDDEPLMSWSEAFRNVSNFALGAT